jgi:predicted nucleic acid-binding protein
VKDRFFLDTNVFVYTFDGRAPRKQKQARALVDAALERGLAPPQASWKFEAVASG